MDFFTRQERSRRTTRLLVLAFLLTYTAIVAATTALAVCVLGVYSPLGGEGRLLEWLAAHAGPLGLVAGGTLLFMLLASLYRAASIAGGGAQVARLLGGTEVGGDTTDLARKRLINVVEEMAIASGLPVPDVYVLEQETGINAFAAGLTPADAAIAVTRGTLDRLDRAELQGVVAHEFSHILNGDMRLNQQLMGLSFGILVLSLIGRWLLRSARFGRRGRNSRGMGAVLGLGAALSLIGGVGLLSSRLIKAAVSRQREMLADASAVQFTRESSALASALKKIAGYGAKLTAVDGEEVAHMLFERGSRRFGGWFATHPPLVDRIRALDPSFDPADLERLAAEPAPAAAASGAGAAPPSVASAAAFSAPIGTAAERSERPSSLLEQAGEIGSPSEGERLRAAVPETLYEAAHSHESSLLLVAALALSADPQARAGQQALLDLQLGHARAQHCNRLFAELTQLERKLRIPLLELAMPKLKQRPPPQLRYLFDLITRLSRLDTERRLFDYVLLRVLAAYLTDLTDAPIDTPVARLSVPAALDALLCVVAAHGHATGAGSGAAAEAGAAAAYRAGFAAIGKRPPREPDFNSASSRDLDRLDEALTRLKRLRPTGRRAALKAVLATIRHDRRVEISEAELFRAIAATLGCPVPPAADL